MAKPTKKPRCRPDGFPIYQGPGYVTRKAKPATLDDIAAVVEKLELEAVPFGVSRRWCYRVTLRFHDQAIAQRLALGGPVALVLSPEKPEKS